MENQETIPPTFSAAPTTWWDLYKQRMEAKVCDLDLFSLGKPNKMMRYGSLSWVSTWVFYSGFKIGVIIQIFTPATKQGVIFQYEAERFSEKLVSILGCEQSEVQDFSQRATQVFKEVEACAEYLRGVLKMVAPKELFL